MKAVSLCAMVILVLQGCSTQTPQQRIEADAKLYDELFGPTCLALGYQKGTDAYRDCKLKVMNAPR